MELTNVGVVGAGMMGVGVAQCLAETGHEVVLVDIDQGHLRKAADDIRRNIRMQNLFRKKRLAEEPGAVFNRVLFTLDFDKLKGSQIVIENVVEKWDVKKEVYELLDSICQPACIFAANTSAISITRIGSATRRPNQTVGMHFMNPVPLTTMVEMVPGYHTSPATLQTAKTLLRQMGKEYVVVNDMPGFVSNRVLMLMINESTFLLQDQVASVADIDVLFKKCFGHRMGPLETADLIGLDTILYSLEVLYESYRDSKYRPCPLLRKMVHAGQHGRKTGSGFYNYDPATEAVAAG